MTISERTVVSGKEAGKSLENQLRGFTKFTKSAASTHSERQEGQGPGS